jgi:hypothetical protein
LLRSPWLPALAWCRTGVQDERVYWNGPCPEAAVLTFIAWLLLLVFCWPLALLALLLYPIVWLLLLPFRLLGVAVEGVFAFLKGIIMLPARILGVRPS